MTRRISPARWSCSGTRTARGGGLSAGGGPEAPAGKGGLFWNTYGSRRLDFSGAEPTYEELPAALRPYFTARKKLDRWARSARARLIAGLVHPLRRGILAPSARAPLPSPRLSDLRHR